MGEKIRDIKSINFGKASFMVELNEGYSASQGRLIHIQNNKFRYLLTEKDFYHLSSMILRAWSEFDYLKHKTPEYKGAECFEPMQAISDDIYTAMSSLCLNLERESIDYRVLDVQPGRVSLLVHPEMLKLFESVTSSVGARRIEHPLGIEAGFKFLYQMTPFKMFSIDNVEIEVFCQLPCSSITSKTWIPLDRMIQQRVWSRYDLRDGDIKWCDKLSRYLFLLCWAVFVDKGFSPRIRAELTNSKSCLSEEDTMKLFSSVFFKYSERIIKKLEREDYDSVIPDYYSFIEY